MKTSGNSVVITGGSEGIGLELARRFIVGGNDVLVCGRRPAAPEEAARAVPGLRTFQCDVRSETSLRALVDYIDREMPRLNVVVNNAAIQWNVNFGDNAYDLDAISAEIETNLTAPIAFTKMLWGRL